MLRTRLLLMKRFWSFFRGYAYMHNIYHRYDLSQCAVVFIPSKNKEYSYYSIKHLKDMLLNAHLEKALFITYDDRIKKWIHKFHVQKYVLDVIEVKKEMSEHIMDFYNTNMSSNAFLVASLDEPYGRNALSYLNTGKITKEDLFVTAVYNITKDLELWME